jgi:hypothetical protein
LVFEVFEETKMADPTASVTVATPDPAASTAAPSVAPVVAAAAPASPVAPDIATPAPAPVDITAGIAQPNRATAVQGSMQPYIDKAQAAEQKAADIANTPVLPPNAPHAKLWNIIAAIGAGLSGAGTAIATHGKEGGAAEVQEIMGARQQQQIAKQQAATAQRDAQIRQQQTIAETNMNLANNVMLMASLPDRLTKEDLDNQSEAQSIAESKANFAASHGGMNADEFNAALSGTGPATGALGGQVNPFFKTTADQQYQAASKILGTNDPYVQALGKTLADPNAAPKDLWAATQRVQQQQALQEKATDAQVKKDTAAQNSVVGKLSTPEALAAPGAQAAIQAKLNDPTTAPEDVPRLQKLLGDAAVAQANAEAIKRREAAAENAVKMGDPNQAGTLLRNHQTTISELKSRGMTPEYIVKAINAAGPGYNAVEADNQAKLAGSEANNQFFGNVNSLISKGGTLDQLADAGTKISQDDLKILNKTKNWAQLQGGKAGISAYAAKLVGVADDYAKVMGGSAGSDTSRGLVLQIVDPSLSPAQRAASIQAMKDAVNSQKTARIAGNPFLQSMYGSADENTSAASSSNPYGAVPR